MLNHVLPIGVFQTLGHNYMVIPMGYQPYNWLQYVKKITIIQLSNKN